MLPSGGMRRLVLASTSPRRLKLLTDAGFSFESIAPEYEEDMTLLLPPAELVKHLSRGKAESVASKVQDGILIAGDTIVVYEGEVIGKPYTESRAREMLRQLSGSVHSVLTGVTVLDTKTGETVSEAIEAKIHFKTLSDLEIDAYVGTGEPLDKAGAYAIQGEGRKFVERIDGDFVTIVGLPIARITEILRSFGIEPA